MTLPFRPSVMAALALSLAALGACERQPVSSLTRVLKSASSDAIVPETCDPTFTTRAGSSVPLTSTRRAMRPDVTSAVWT